MAVQEKSTDLGPPEEKIGIMLAGAMGVGGATSLILAMRGDSVWNDTPSPLVRLCTSPLRTTSAAPLVTTIS